MISETKGVYLNQHVTTGQLRQSALDLLGTDMEVVELYSANVDTINPGLASLSTPTLIMSMLNPQYLSDKLRKRWIKARAWNTRLLVTAGIMSYPDSARIRMGEYLDSASKLTSIDAAKGFLAISRSRIERLSSGRGRDMTGLKLSEYAFVEDMIVHSGIHEGVFFANPAIQEN